MDTMNTKNTMTHKRYKQRSNKQWTMNNEKCTMNNGQLTMNNNL